MKLRAVSILILFISAPGLQAEPNQKSPQDEQERVHKVAKDFKACPAGHTSLKDIPIIYGRFGVHYKKPADYTEEDIALSEKQKRGEVVLGGDLIPPNPPKFRVVCSKCGYLYSPDLFTLGEANQPEGVGDWILHSPDSRSFKQPLSKFLRSFPIMKPDVKSVSYGQTITADGQVVTSEDLNYTTTLSPLEAKKQISSWLAESKQGAADITRVENAYAYHTYQCDMTGLYISIIDDEFWNPGHVCVWICVWPKVFRDEK